MAVALRLTDLMIRSLEPGAARSPQTSVAGCVEVAGLTADSRKVEPGFLFAALPGSKTNGADFISAALARGASAILAAPGVADLPDSAIPVIEDKLPRRRFAKMAAAFYGAQPEAIAAVTGTSGKSSTVSFARQIWRALDIDAASIGTLGVESDAITRYSGLTTADPVELHADLAALARAGVTHAAMEASSHGLDQYRLDGVRVGVAGFTGFGRDHLDYHVSTDAYFAAKARLFAEVLMPGGVAVLNADIPEFESLAALSHDTEHLVFSYGRSGRAIRILDQTSTTAGQSLTLDVFGRRYDVEIPLVGNFQAMNALCALGLVLGADKLLSNFDRAVAALNRLEGVRGRLELAARLPNGAAIYVDYAHKPDALATVLNALRLHTRGKLAVVFGCGGDRDRGKRPLMGEIATRLADRVIVTDDNPRSENSATIRAEILAAAPGALDVGDRAQAIAAGIESLAPDDILVIAGKGHEQGQIVGNEVLPFDDASVVRAITGTTGR